MRRSSLIFNLLLSWVLSGTCFSKEANFQKIDRYAFSLEKVSIHQHFLDEESLRNISQDAVSGIFDPRYDFYSFVIPTSYGGEELSHIANTLIKVLPIQEAEISVFSEQKFQKLESFRFSLKGIFSQEPIEYLVELVLYGSLLYQHVSFVRSPTEEFPGILELMPKFRIDKEKQPEKPPGAFSMPTFDQAWFIDKGFYYHAGYGVKIPLEFPGWTYKAGDLPREFHPHALIAFESPTGSHALYVLASKHESTLQAFFDSFRMGFSNPEMVDLTHSSDSFHWSFKLNREPYPLRYQVKGLQKGKTKVLLVLYSLRDQTASFPVPLLTRFRFLSDSASSKVHQNLRSPKLQYLLVDKNQSLSATGYQNFDYGLSWTFASTDVTEGGLLEEATFDADYEIFVHNYSQNFQSTLELERDRFLPHKEFHEDYLSNIIGVRATETLTRSNLLISSFEMKEQKLHYLLMTSVKGSLFLRCVLWSPEFLDPKTFPYLPDWNPKPPVEMSLELYQNHRLNFSIKRKKNWIFRTITTDEVKPIGEVLEIRERLAEHELYVMNSLFLDEGLCLELFSQSKPYLQSLREGKAWREWFQDLEVSVKELHFLLRGKPRLLIQRTFRRGTTLFSAFTLQDPGIDKMDFFTHSGLKI